ncbi:hypothetical protein I4I73_09390 [Pseudonocardia sp. KRD-184]|uniref:HEPN domain-containing protein n=1 Tax=Pseudonocardia oceani TaxID=2792013 RepID=A0ABS6UH10_9PSEU|nr:hypothetical protein [Pseudonocardia oceani]MBW0092984.1 hypothetical protein [Pseudonocardia oceani]MBW0096201.1 hypothetical protein [Pseudonocardia oceani]MBW0109836.1 hypothetical protein [Pseudonocardia oceani]MBW0120093.1 hypothetical protein [Pseudonocardia oceani]MBW0131513.1 hypothetical protein [Pseudonocardia oceani]
MKDVDGDVDTLSTSRSARFQSRYLRERARDAVARAEVLRSETRRLFARSWFGSHPAGRT